MTFHHSLRTRVIIAFSLFGLLLSIVYGLAVYNALHATEDRLLAQQLQDEVNDFLLRYQSDRLTSPPTTRHIRSFWGVDTLPSALTWLKNKTLADGYYEFGDQDIHMVATTLDDRPERLFVIYDVATLETGNAQDIWLIIILGLSALLVTLLGIGLGVLITKVVLAPVVQLAHQVERLSLVNSPSNLSTDFAGQIKAERFYQDEIGLLAKTLQKTLQRLGDFVEREQRFSRDASHELRTPVAVVGGATELLRQLPLPSSAERPLARIERAVCDMHNTIELFLYLGRELDESYSEPFAVIPVIEHAIDQHRYLLSDKDLDLQWQCDADLVITGQAQAFAIAINNLIRNAFEHAPPGVNPITITLTQDTLIISNQGQLGVSEPEKFYARGVRSNTSQGFGLGLNIVERLCERCGWSLVLKADANSVTACLDFSSINHPNRKEG